MINAALISVIAFCALFQPNAPRLFAAVAFAAITLCHHVFLSDLDGLYYYGSAALFDLAIIILTSGINPVPDMVLSLHRICFVSILANLAGWILWACYLPPLAYNISFGVIYLWAVITLIKRNGDDVGGFTLGSWASCFRFNTSAVRLDHIKYKGEA